MIKLLEQWINENKEMASDDPRGNLINAYLTKIKEEKNRQGNTFTGNRSKHFLSCSSLTNSTYNFNVGRIIEKSF